MVAAICAWHEYHVAAAAEIERRLDRGEQLAVSAPALVESYAVLTRLPAPHRLSPADAWTLLEVNFVEHRRIIVLTGAAYVAIVRALANKTKGLGRRWVAVIIPPHEITTKKLAGSLPFFPEFHA